MACYSINEQYYCMDGLAYIVPQIRELADTSSLTANPDDEVFWGYMSSYNTYVEIMSFKKVIDDATMRNKIFFHKLNLE